LISAIWGFSMTLTLSALEARGVCTVVLRESEPDVCGGEVGVDAAADAAKVAYKGGELIGRGGEVVRKGHAV
jgi:hypothetical protein